MKERIITFNDCTNLVNNYFKTEEIVNEKNHRYIKWYINEDTYEILEKREWILKKNDEVIEGINKIKDIYEFLIKLKNDVSEVKDVSCGQEVEYDIKRYNQTTLWKVLNRVYKAKDDSTDIRSMLKDLYAKYPEEFSNGYRCLCSKKRRDFINSLLKLEE